MKRRAADFETHRKVYIRSADEETGADPGKVVGVVK
jgi:hypothetical protein